MIVTEAVQVCVFVCCTCDICPFLGENDPNFSWEIPTWDNRLYKLAFKQKHPRRGCILFWCGFGWFSVSCIALTPGSTSFAERRIGFCCCRCLQEFSDCSCRFPSWSTQLLNNRTVVPGKTHIWAQYTFDVSALIIFVSKDSSTGWVAAFLVKATENFHYKNSSSGKYMLFNLMCCLWSRGAHMIH